MFGKSLGRHLAVMAMAMVIAFSLGLTADADRHKKGDAAAAGFLGDYADLEPGPDGGAVRVYRKQPGVLAGYDKLILDPVLMYFHRRARGTAVNPEELHRMSDFLRVKTREALEQAGFEVVEEPGPHTVRLRAAITGVDSIPPGAGGSSRTGLLIPTLDVGRASIEAEILDSVSDELLVAVVDADKGKRFLHLETDARKWRGVQGAVEQWVVELRQNLRQPTAADGPDEIRAGGTPDRYGP